MTSIWNSFTSSAFICLRTSADQIGREADVDREEEDGIEPTNRAVVAHDEEEERHQGQDGIFQADGVAADGERADDGREPEDEGDVEDVRADDIADGDRLVAPQGRNEADGELRHGGPRGDDGQPDDRRGHPGERREGDRTAEQKLPAADQQEEPEEDKT